ncbi:MAG: hypothetical protein Q8L10_04830 [Candidatus Moranbacteria bacterium]|nr:hypothetical protein [Candidatus Moranbacteria bacterium]
MDWREKVQLLNTEITALKKKAAAMTGINDLGRIEKLSDQPPIEYYLKKVEALKNLRAYRAGTGGASCIILTSSIYPEFGILIFEGEKFGGGGTISLNVTHHNYSVPYFSAVCGCCSPHLKGIPNEEYITDGCFSEEKGRILRSSFVAAVRRTCTEFGINILLVSCYDEFMKQDFEGLHLIKSFKGEVDRWRFAAAFKEVKIRDSVFPFDKFFE